ncbi:substrate-binding domain-containing protein [Moritella dasanensis]|uniref:substrate-binding domain-containing protein n=1 Tax=Moritella dasanensis TaxID=428031 RepID=UPI000368612C|nr:substrate-binding domain-containing protein [Moritella dasanensis]
MNSPVTAVVCYNDYVVAGALTALETHHISVPNDISLMGFDNGLIAKYLHPKLSTMHYPIQTMAEQAAALSLALAKGNNSDIKGKVFEAILVERLSVTKRA